MALPNVTPEQRAKALEKAAQVRKARKELKENIKSSKTDPASVLKTRKDDPLVSKMKVKEFLQAIPGIGGAKADKIMHDVDIPGNRRLGGLGIRQAEALLEYLSQGMPLDLKLMPGPSASDIKTVQGFSNEEPFLIEIFQCDDQTISW